MRGNELMVRPVASRRLTLERLAAMADLHPSLVEKLIDYGLLEPAGMEDEVMCFQASAVRRLRTIERLRRDLGINLPGIAVALDLLERIQALKRELESLRAPNSMKRRPRGAEERAESSEEG